MRLLARGIKKFASGKVIGGFAFFVLAMAMVMVNQSPGFAGDTTPPAQATGFIAGDGENGQSTLSWENPTDSDFSGVKILRRADGTYPTGPNDSQAQMVWQDTDAPVAPTYTDVGLTNGVSYNYAIFTRDSSGNWNSAVTPGVNADTARPTAALTVTSAPVASGTVKQGQARVVMQRLDLSTDGSTASLNSITVQRTGSSQDSDISAVRVFIDSNNDGSVGAGDSQIGTAGFVDASAAVSISPQTIGTSPSHFLIAFDIADDAGVGATLGSLIADKNSIGVSNSARVVPFSGYASHALTVGGDSVSISSAPVAAGAYPGEKSVVLQHLTASTDCGTALLSGIVIDKLGSLPDDQIAAVKVYADQNGNGSIDAPDVQLGEDATFSGGRVEIAFPGQAIATSAKHFLVVYDIANTAPTGASIGSRIASQASVSVSEPDAVVGFANYDSKTLSIKALAVTFSGCTQLGGTIIHPGEPGRPMMRFTAVTNGGVASWRSFRLDEYGSGEGASTVAAVKLYRDNGDNAFDPKLDTSIGLAPATFTADSSVFEIDGGETLTANPQTYFVVYDMAQEAPIGATVGAKMVDNSYITLAAGAVEGVSNFASGTPKIQPDPVLVSGVGTAPSTALPGQSGIKMLELTMATDYGETSLNSLKIFEYGSGAAATNVSAVKIYRDNGDNAFNAGTDALLTSAPGTFTGETTTFTLPSQTLTMTPCKFYIIYDLSSSAGSGGSIGAELTDASFVGVAPPSIVSMSGPIRSGETQVNQQRVTVSSQPIARGSVTVYPTAPSGQDNVAMQALSLKTNYGNATLRGFTLEEYGSGAATNNVATVSLVKETNGRAGYQGPDSQGVAQDTVMATSPATFGAEAQAFTFQSPETITPSSATYYVVYAVKNTAAVGSNIGSRLSNQSSIAVDAPYDVAPFSNYQSNLLTVVSTPHSGYSSLTNLCATCHSVHKAQDFSTESTITPGSPNSSYKLLNKTLLKDPDIVNGYDHKTFNMLCEACHDGTGASLNIRADYDGTGKAPGHVTKNSGSISTGWAPPPSGKQYNAGVKLPCTTCHSPHGSGKGNYKMLSDALYNYATRTTGGGGWVDPTGNGKIDQGDEECVVCHEPASSSTAPSSRGGTVLGIDMKMPPKHNPTSKCLDCHATPHDLETAPDDCSSCHAELCDRAANRVSGLNSTHTISSASGNETNADGSCTGTCHSGHLHEPNANNVWSNAVTHLAPVGGPFGDFSTSAPYGLCLSCHTTTQSGTSAGSPITTQPISASNYGASAHQYTYDSRTSTWDNSAFKSNCGKCHRDSDESTTQSKYGPHASQYKKLAFAGVDSTNGYVEEGLCIKCHSVRSTKNPNGAAGKDFYNIVSMASGALNIDSVLITKLNTHRTYEVKGKHLKASASEGPADVAAPNNRHAECEDCHEVHAAKSGTHSQGTNVASNALIGVPGVQPSSWPNGASGSWTNDKKPTNWSSVTSIAYEWQLCLKCHSTYTTQPTDSTRYTWGANADAGISANQQTNQALEFNPNNASYHGVVQPLQSGNWLLGKSTPQFRNGWNGSMTMYCSDCHKSETSSDPAGPHGSNNPFVLIAPWSVNTGTSGTDNDLCFQCHERGTYGGNANNAATASGFSNSTSGNLHNICAKNQACVKCHTLIPHGWKRKKMLTTTGDAAPYRDASAQSNILSWDASGSWQKASCGSQGSGCH